MNHHDVRRYDSSGVPDTCSLIDKVITHLQKSEDPDAQDFIEDMEKIRTHNENLREHGAELNRDLQEEINSLQETIEEKKERIYDLEDEIEDLRRTILKLEANSN